MRGSRYTIGIAITVAATAVVLLILFRLMIMAPAVDSTSVTVVGETVCLPHKDTSGPVTMECAYGLLADDGRYFALETTDLGLAGLATNTRVEVKGALNAPLANEKYDIAGRIKVTSYDPK